MTRFRFYTASSIDGFLADDADNLDWLFAQPIDENGPLNYGEFIAGIGVVVMGATTYEWIVARNARTGEAWQYPQPTWVFTHRDLHPIADNVRIVAGRPADFGQTLIDAAGDKDVWIVGGGDLATQFADAGLLHELVICFAPVTLGSGRPLFTKPYDLELRELDRNKAFIMARYDVVGARAATG